ncbi:MAG: efflux RND transporter permease subunit [Candidatus Thiodiazotropha endolucinida]|nr:efflux RND transporter permease subunit [Candidatus Thiodiazotropha taylori]MCW4330610.1 efflux RND transporter permease subunit [Candidatus Thiodiazotropha endolucinida]MCG8058644.1 efflux RND transporter permease subunit [Candidatus Thiodiazotropha taylori]MCG8064522.1 efflux RND transporter permease subunit [Candidatus Thiodiazotropha taylori]MCW4341764.1 efflux RND transporter permease subunit [Candidatus Thiodiazotropha endolucinida]
MSKLGISGGVAKRFLITEITPLLALVGLLLGVFAVLVTPREEEPQINVTFANVFIPFPGATATEIENLVATPAEQVLSEIDGIKHVYSTSRPGMAVLTVQFLVGEDREDAIVRLFSKVYANQDWLPQGLGVGQPIIKPKGIDDVPIVTATLWSEDPAIGAFELGQVAHAIESELKRVPGTRDIYTIGNPDRVVHVLLDPQSLAGHGIDLSDLRTALQAGNHIRDNIEVTAENRELLVQAGTFLTSPDEIGSLVVGVREGKAVYLRDVAEVVHRPDQPQHYVWMGVGPQGEQKQLPKGGKFPAVTVVVAKKAGTNAVDIAKSVIKRFEQLDGIFIPEGVHATITRNYGATAEAKANKLISKLAFATLSVVGLVLLTIGWREAFIVGAAVVVTLAITLFASWAWGFTLNRVSLFALIFSIGILVDDAIVVVENIHRHLQMGSRHLLEAIPKAVDEVGGPTILATFTVIAALLPMAFVTGLMGPYMSPIPINASTGMLISLVVAFVFTPWMTNRILASQAERIASHAHDESQETALSRFFSRVMAPFLTGKRGNRMRWVLLGSILLLIAASLALVATKSVVLKMLPFDNKSEFQVVLDMPEGTSLEQTARVLDELGDYLSGVEEVSDYQVYAGTASPIGFNGLVRQYYLREGAHLGDIQVNLVDKQHRERKSHEVALAVRGPLQAIAREYNGNLKVVEVPPGPPVMSPLVAEVYGLDYEGQTEAAWEVRKVFENTPDIIDVDDSVEYPSAKFVVQVDRAKAARLGVPQSALAEALSTVLAGEDASYLHGENLKYAVPIRIEYAEEDKADLDQVLALRVRAQSGKLVPLSEIVQVIPRVREYSIHHKDLLPVVYVTGDMAGETDSPLYGLFEISDQLQGEGGIEQWFLQQPENPYAYSLKWDGEWQITYDTFRDMGIAYSVGLLMIYLLVVAQFRSYLVPLVIMAPIPLTVIGILPGHALLGAQFTATSMIGMIALAGIIVRNSILLVDFINQQVREGMALEQAVIDSAAVRAKPIALTALAAMAGGFFILDDPIFSGLAVSLIFGLFVSTVLTLVVIPVVYYAAMRNRVEFIRAGE